MASKCICSATSETPGSTHGPKRSSQESVIGKEISQCEADKMKNRCHQSLSAHKGLEDKGKLSYLYFRHHQLATSVALGPPGRTQELYHDTGYVSHRSISEERLWSAECTAKPGGGNSVHRSLAE